MQSERDPGRPFFSIGVPTFNRHELLRETLSSIVVQDFADFEVIVGNDYTGEVLAGEMLGIDDRRIRFVNHPRNLREVGNMNALLAAARGRYFTWLFDDDLFEAGWLRTAHEVLVREEERPAALFPRYRVLQGEEPYRAREVDPGAVRRYTGRDFLGDFFRRRLDVISTTAFFETERFREMVGGVEELCDSAVGLYCEYLLLVKCALLGEIACIDAPYVVFRAHADSWGASNTEVHKYLEGGERLVRRCSEVLHHPDLREDLTRNLLGIGKIHLSKLCFAAMRSEAATPGFGLGAVGRAWRVVWRELRRVGRAAAVAGDARGGRAAARLALIAAKCAYLILFSYVYYGRRRVPSAAPAPN
jgi:glycosyltransferase involved in cell wall biosynthesis